MGKGSSPRPYSVSKSEYDDRFETIFGKRKKFEESKPDVVQETKPQDDQSDDQEHPVSQ